MIYAFTVHWLIAPVYFLTVPLLGILSSVLSRKIKVIQKTDRRRDDGAGGIDDRIAAQHRAREEPRPGAAGNRPPERDHRQDPRLELQKVRYLRSLSFIQGTAVNLLRTSILFLMLYLIFAQQITVGQFFSLFIYSFFIFGPLQELGNVINTYRETEASLANFEPILRMPKEPRPLEPVGRGPAAQARIRRGRLPASDGHVAGARRHLVHGGTRRNGGVRRTVGLGKDDAGQAARRTCTRRRPGGFCYNGMPSTDVDLDRLRERIGFVTQDTQLFSGTIRENLLFVNPDATDAECLEVLHQAACDSLLARADQGLDTVIGEGGVKVSGGEKQRLSIARALLRRPQLLVFDEATSSLDSLTEEEITETIREVTAEPRRHHDSDRAPALDGPARRPYLRPRARAASSSRAATTSSLAQKGLYYAMWRQQIGERRAAPAPVGVAMSAR